MTSARMGEGGQAQVDACGRGQGVKPHMDVHTWTFTQKIISYISKLFQIFHNTSARFVLDPCGICRYLVLLKTSG